MILRKPQVFFAKHYSKCGVPHCLCSSSFGQTNGIHLRCTNKNKYFIAIIFQHFQLNSKKPICHFFHNFQTFGSNQGFFFFLTAHLCDFLFSVFYVGFFSRQTLSFNSIRCSCFGEPCVFVQVDTASPQHHSCFLPLPNVSPQMGQAIWQPATAAPWRFCQTLSSNETEIRKKAD